MQFVKQRAEIISSFMPEEALKLIERAGRVSHKSEGSMGEGTAEPFIKMLRKYGHDSVLEHFSVTVAVTTDRGVSHEIVRHRIGSYTQESTRYCNYSKGKYNRELTYILTKNMMQESEYLSVMYHIEQAYNALANKGYKPDDLRDILPNCLKTEIIITYNLRSWRHFLQLRLSPNAHPKIREIARMILEQLNTAFPCVFDDISEDGSLKEC